MKPIDFAKAFGLGAAALALNLLTLVVLVFVYAQLIEPGRPPAFYNEMAPRIGSWSAPIAGPLIIFLLVWLFSRKNRRRNAYLFAAMVFASYLVLDGGMGVAMAPAGTFLGLPFVLGMVGSALAAFAGAFVGASGRSGLQSSK
jgi:hypothetical protein